MISRGNMNPSDTKDIWSRLAEPVPTDAIAWRQDGKVTTRNGKFYARFVPYIEANTVRERLDAVVPGEWDLTLELLPPSPAMTENEEGTVSFKARLQILGVIREDVGQGRDYKAASTDAFKRAGTRFGIGHELYDYDQNWVQVDSDSRFAKPVIDPGIAYGQRHSGNGSDSTTGSSSTTPVERAPAPARRQETSARSNTVSARGDEYGNGEAAEGEVPNDAAAPACPKCGGRMWDNRLSKRNPKAPDFKCRDRSCDGVIWPARTPAGRKLAEPVDNDGPAFPGDPGHDEIPGHTTLDSSPLGMSLDDIPF